MHKRGLKVSLPHPTFEFRLKTEEAPSSELDTTKIGISHLNKILEKCGKKNIDFWEEMIRLNILDSKVLENFRSAWFPSAPHPEEMYRCDMCNELKKEPLLDTNVMRCRACWDGIIDYKSTSLALCFTKSIKQFYIEYASEKLGKSLKEFLGKRNPEDMLISSPPLSINRTIILVSINDISGTVRKKKTFKPNTTLYYIGNILLKLFIEYSIKLEKSRLIGLELKQQRPRVATHTYELRLKTDEAPSLAPVLATGRSMVLAPPHIGTHHRAPHDRTIAPLPHPDPAPYHRVLGHHLIIPPLPHPAPHHRTIAPSHHHRSSTQQKVG